MKEQRTEQVVFRLTPSEAQMLDKMVERCGDSRTLVARSIVLAVLDDDARAHGEPGLRALCQTAVLH